MGRKFTSASSEYGLHEAARVTGPPFTMSAWIRSTSASAAQGVVAIGRNAAGNGVHLLWIDGAVGGDPVKARSQDGVGATDASSATGYTANVWHHVFGIWESTTSRYAGINGVKGTQNTTSRAPAPNRTIIGANSVAGTPSLFMSGDIAEVAIHACVLTDAELLELAFGKCARFVRPDLLAHYWPLVDPNPGLAALDNGQIGWGANLTWTGTIVATSHPNIWYPPERKRVFAPAAAVAPPTAAADVIGGGVGGYLIGA